MERKRRMRGYIVVCLLFALLMSTGCTSAQQDFSSEERPYPAENMTVIGVSQLGSESMWRSANTASIQQVFTKENGYFLMNNNARQKQENQIKAIRSFISQQVDYIIFSPIVESGWDTVLKEAKEAKIPVIIMDRNVDSDPSLYTAWVGSDFTEEGRNAGRWLEEELRGKNFSHSQVNIVILQGTPGSTAMLGRTEGFQTVADRHENWNILACENADFTTAKGKEVMSEYLKKYSDIDVIVSQNDDMTIGVLQAISEAGYTTGTGGDMTLISFDGTKSALEKVKSGLINVDIECNPLLGPYLEEIVCKLENGEPVDKINYVEEKIFTQKNVLSVLDNRIY